MKQLVFGMLDVPLSLYSRPHYLPEIFMRILRTNLRAFYLSQGTEFLEENMGRKFFKNRNEIKLIKSVSEFGTPFFSKLVWFFVLKTITNNKHKTQLK